MNLAELKTILDAEGIDPRTYQFRDGLPDDTLCLSAESGGWCEYYSECGKRWDERFLHSEDAGCRELLRRLRGMPLVVPYLDVEP